MSSKSLAVPVATLFILCGAVYWPYLGNPLVFDDLNIFNGTTFLDFALEFKIAPRWLPYATLAHTYVIADGSIPALRIGNWFLHSACSATVYVLLLEFYLAAVPASQEKGALNVDACYVAYFGAALLAAHPVAVYAVGYLVQRTILMATLFVLLTWIAFMRGLITGQGKYWIWTVIFYGIALFSKEAAIMAPAGAFLMLLALRPAVTPARWALILVFAAYLAMALVMVAMMKGILGRGYEPQAENLLGVALPDAASDGYARSIATQVRIFFKYFLLWALPDVRFMAIDMREPFASGLLKWPYWLFALLFLLYPAITFRLVLARGLIGLTGWLLTLPWLMFITELSTIRVQEVLVLYRGYLWFALTGALLPLILLRMKAPPVLRYVVMLATLCVLGAMSWNRLDTMTTPLLLWSDAAKLLSRDDEAGAGRIFYNRAQALLEAGRKEEALQDMNRVVKSHPDLPQVYFHRARISFSLARYPEVLDDLTQVIRIRPASPDAYYARAMTYRRLGRDAEMTTDLKAGCALKSAVACYALEKSGHGILSNPRNAEN